MHHAFIGSSFSNGADLRKVRLSRLRQHSQNPAEFPSFPPLAGRYQICAFGMCPLERSSRDCGAQRAILEQAIQLFDLTIESSDLCVSSRPFV
jgi:hypothetical protein